MGQENNLHMPKIEKPLKEIVRQNNFLGLSSKKWLATRLASGGEALFRELAHLAQ